AGRASRTGRAGRAGRAGKRPRGRRDLVGARLASPWSAALIARPQARRPIAVAITGGIGAGKSTALAAFRRHGAATVSSDEIVHHLLATDDQVRDALVDRLGEQILGA